MNDFPFEILMSSDDFMISVDCFDDLRDYDRYSFYLGRFFCYKKGTWDFIFSSVVVQDEKIIQMIESSTILPLVSISEAGELRVNELRQVSYKID